MFSSRCSTEEVPGIGSISGERCSNHASATCMGLARYALRDSLQGLFRRFARAQREPGNEHDSVLLAIVHHVVPLAIGEAVTVLHRNDWHNFASAFDVFPRYIGQARSDESSLPTATRPACLATPPETQSDQEYEAGKHRCGPGAAFSSCPPPLCANGPASHCAPTAPVPDAPSPPWWQSPDPWDKARAPPQSILR